MVDTSSSLLKKIRRIQFQTTHLADDVLAGAYRSAFRGRGMEFEEVREYQPGDEIRTIDWNVTARMNHPYVKSFREEREITLTLAVDISSSTRFGSGHHLKSDLIAEIAAVLAFSAIKNNDKVALLLFSQDVEKYYPPKKGLRHVLKIIRELLVTTPRHQGTNISAALAFLGRVKQRSGICFLISDFICQDYSHEAAIIAKEHELVCLALSDPTESRFPAMGLTTLYDLETGVECLIDTESSQVQKALKSKSAERMDNNRQLMRKVGGDFCEIHTERPYLAQLRKFFLLRQMRRR